VCITITSLSYPKEERRVLVVVPHGLDVISVINDHVLDRIKVDGQGVLVVESDASHFTNGRYFKSALDWCHLFSITC
jgi:hypothetical protein